MRSIATPAGCGSGLLDEIGKAVPFDAYSWLLTDPETEVGCGPLADVPCLPELPRLIRFKYLTAINRWTSLDVPVALLRAATGGRPERSLVWREVLRRYGVNDVASVVFRDRFGCWSFLDLWRIDSGSPFADGEAEFLSEIAAPITGALRRCQAGALKLVASGQDERGPAVLMLSPELEVRIPQHFGQHGRYVTGFDDHVFDGLPSAPAIEVDGPAAGDHPRLPDTRLGRPPLEMSHQTRADTGIPPVGSHDHPGFEGRWVTVRGARVVHAHRAREVAAAG